MQSEDVRVTVEGVLERVGISGGMLHLIKLEGYHGGRWKGDFRRRVC